MRTSVIVVTWNGLHLLQACVAALAQQTLPHDLIVVDNGSTDGTNTWIKQHAPDAKLIALPHNLGFAGGNNVGIRAASGDQIVLINNDTIAPPHFLEQLVAPLAQSDQIGSVAGVLVFAHRSDLIASAGIGVGQDGVHRDLWALHPITALPPQPHAIFGPSGGAVCFRRRALEDVGLFDRGFFNYLEDADLSWRLRLRGWNCVVAPHAHIRHVYSATGGQGSPFKQRLLARNRWRVIVRCFPPAILRACWPHMIRYDLLALGYAVLRRQPAIISGRAAVLRDLPTLIAERRAIQARRTAAVADLESWLDQPITVHRMLAEQRSLAAVLQHA